MEVGEKEVSQKEAKAQVSATESKVIKTCALK